MARIREHEPMNYDIEVVDQPLRPIAAAAWATTWERFPGEWGGRLGLGAAHEAVRRWGASQGREITGERWEVYGDWHDDPAQPETWIFYGLADARGPG